jgi:4-diphosphocytidyl-2-C-methyl-D-erythritol kinase
MLTETAAAKINLHLHVVGRRDDGYHLLDSLVVFAGTGDQLTAAPADDLRLSLTGPFAGGLAEEGDNLVLRAARALAQQAGITPAAHLTLEKHLPVASGIGGGSADAAAALRLLCRLWRIDPDAEDLHRIARGLGADVPVCLAGQPARMAGIGEVLLPAPPLPPFGMVLVNPGVGIATPAVFKARSGAFSNQAELPAGWPDALALAETLHILGNDLEAPARQLVPVIGDVLDVLAADPSCLLARMSGSGATCFGLYETPQAARVAAAGLPRSGWWVWGGALAA